MSSPTNRPEESNEGKQERMRKMDADRCRHPPAAQSKVKRGGKNGCGVWTLTGVVTHQPRKTYRAREDNARRQMTENRCVAPCGRHWSLFSSPGRRKSSLVVTVTSHETCLCGHHASRILPCTFHGSCLCGGRPTVTNAHLPCIMQLSSVAHTSCIWQHWSPPLVRGPLPATNYNCI